MEEEAAKGSVGARRCEASKLLSDSQPPAAAVAKMAAEGRCGTGRMMA
jgi:hypothetical protein